MKKKLYTLIVLLITAFTVSCTQQTTEAPQSTEAPQANEPNPASVFCEEQGYRLEIRTAEDGSQAGMCIFPDGSECDEWAFFRGECGPVETGEGPANNAGDTGDTAIGPETASGDSVDTTDASLIPTPMPIDPAGYQGWWTYTHPVYGFSIRLPEDWIVDEVTSGDALMNGHTLNLLPNYDTGRERIRMTFRSVGEEVPLWPTGVGQGEFIPQGSLDIAGEPAERILLVCPTGEVTAIWYHQADGQPSILRGDEEFGFIFSAGSHCEAGNSLTGKVQLLGEMIIASLEVP